MAGKIANRKHQMNQKLIPLNLEYSGMPAFINFNDLWNNRKSILSFDFFKEDKIMGSKVYSNIRFVTLG